jgi:hypothetical protein
MTGEFLSFLGGLTFGVIFRSRVRRQTKPSVWNDLIWTDTVWIEGETGFSPQLVNLHNALRKSADAQGARVRAKNSGSVPHGATKSLL